MSTTELQIIEPSPDLIRALPSDQLYALEQAGQIARDILDGRIAAWVEEGWTQRRIGEEIGISGPAVNKRLQRLGLRTKDARGGARSANPVSRVGEIIDADAEVVEEIAPTPSEAAERLRQLGGGQRTPEMERRLAEARARGTVWTAVEIRKRDRIKDRLDAALDEYVQFCAQPGLSRPGVADALGKQATEVAHVVSAMRTLAWEFER